MDCGIMQPDGTISEEDKARVLNGDECPQMADYGLQKGNAKEKVACSAGGRAPLKVSPKNRDCNTIDMVIGLGGFQYGLHINVARSGWTEGSVPDTLAIFTHRILEEQKMSTYGMLTASDCGMNTGEVKLARLKMLHKELVARGVKFPVVYMADNHSSNLDVEIKGREITT